MKKTDNFVFQALHIIAWIIFVGLCIEAGALLVNFVYSMFNPKVLHNLYQKLDLSEVYTQSKWAFFGIYSFILVISILKAYLFYIIVKLTSKLNLIVKNETRVIYGLDSDQVAALGLKKTSERAKPKRTKKTPPAT